MRSWIIAAGLGGFLVVAGALQAGEDKGGETPDDSLPSAIVVRISKAGDADSDKVANAVAQPLRAAFAGKDVLFLDVDVTTKETRHQAKLLLNSLDLGSIWKKHGTKPGTLVVYDVSEGSIAETADAKSSVDKAKKAVEGILAKASSGDEEEGAEEEMPEDDGGDEEDPM